ncbi:MAG: DUF1385 domain-containing protein, partial [Armatimonadota bacterium]|nr:DUF1385 domain-containing protein [Armatimonadota bacterium]
MMKDDTPSVIAPAVIPEASLRDALDTLHRSGNPSLSIQDSHTGQVIAILARPGALPPPAPPRLGGMATPLGVYLHDGVSSGGAGFWGLFLTGVTMSVLALLAQAMAHGVAHGAEAHLAGLLRWESRAPYGLQLWLSAVSQWLPLPLVFLLLRLVPMSGTHAAEHQVVHCIEHQSPLVPECVRSMPRVHPRCGTNLFAGFTLFLMAFLAVFCAAQAGGWPLLDAASLAVMLAAPVTVIFWRRVGGWLQQWFATRPATDAQIAGAISAAEQILSRRRRRMERGETPRFAAVRRVWCMGFPQILLGYLAVFGLVTLVDALWPGFGWWA